MGSCFLTCGTAATQIKMGKGQNEGGFSEDQLQMYKDCFKLMDINKDGTLDKNDLRGAFDNVGVLMSEGELDGLLGEIGGACTYDNMVKMVQAFKAYDNEGKIDSKMFTHALMTWGDKMTKAEIDDIFGEFEIDEDYMIKSKDVIGLFVAVKEEEKKEEAPPPVEEAAPAEEEEEEGRQVNGYFSISMKPQRPLSFPVQAGRLDGFLLESWALPDADFSATFVTFLNSSI